MSRFNTLSSPPARSLLVGVALVLVLGGCRSCGAEPPVPEVVKKAELEAEKPVKSAKLISWEEQRQARSIGSAEKLGDIEMMIPDAAEEARALTDAVERAKALVLGGGVGPATEARSLLTSRLAEAPTDPDALYWMGRSYQAERIQVPAIEWYQRAVESDPEFVSAHRWLAYTLLHEQRCKEAKVHLDAAVASRPEQADVLVDRGVCSADLRDVESALVDFKAACELEPFEWCGLLDDVEERLKARSERRMKARQMSSKLSKGGGLDKSKMGKKGKLGKLGGGRGKFGKGKLPNRTKPRPATEE